MYDHGTVTNLQISKKDKSKHDLTKAKTNNLELPNSKATSSYTTVTDIECIENVGIYGDDNAKGGDRQVTLMDDYVREWIEQQEAKELCAGKFKANITIKDVDFTKLHQGTLLSIGEAVLEISSISKKCYGEVCKLYDKEQTCPIPAGCCFAKVVKSGRVNLADRCIL